LRRSKHRPLLVATVAWLGTNNNGKDAPGARILTDGAALNPSTFLVASAGVKFQGAGSASIFQNMDPADRKRAKNQRAANPSFHIQGLELHIIR